MIKTSYLLPIHSEETVIFSDIRPGSYFSYQDDIISMNQATEILRGNPSAELHLVTETFIQSVMHQIYEDEKKGISREAYQYPGIGPRVIYES